MNSLLVLEEVVSSVKPLPATVAGWYWASELLRAMYLTLMAFKSAFVAETFPAAGFVIADVCAAMCLQLTFRRTMDDGIWGFIFVRKRLIYVLNSVVMSGNDVVHSRKIPMPTYHQ